MNVTPASKVGPRSSRSFARRWRWVDRLPRGIPWAAVIGIALCLALAPGARAQDTAPDPEIDASVLEAEAIAPAPTPNPSAARRGAARHHQPAGRPKNLLDIEPWLDFKEHSEKYAFPEEARLFYRRGLLAHQSGKMEEAARLVRGAATLDPTFADPHRTLISWFLFREPGQALVHCASLFELMRRSFAFQLALAANAINLTTVVLLFSLLFAGLIVVVTRNHELRHGWQEHLSRFIRPRAAKKWPWALLVLPYAVGLGLALPTVAFLALLWPSLKLRERTLFILLTGSLVAVPWVTSQIGRLERTLDVREGPFYGIMELETQVYSEEQRQRLTALAEAHPKDAFLHFAKAWTARQWDDLESAESAYRHTLELWPDDDRVLNNLANVLAMAGRQDEALEVYRRTIRTNPKNAAAYFNIAQAHTRRFDFRAASDALAHASTLDFDLVSSHQKQTTEDRPMPLVDQWIAPQRLWEGLLAIPADQPSTWMLPPAWRGRIEFSGWPFSIAVLITAVLGLIVGMTQHRFLPLRRCGNCEQIVCRRCAQRRREIGLCRSCAAVESRAKAPDFARVLLTEHRRKVNRPIDITRTAVAILIPGFGLLAFRRVFLPLLLIAVSAVMVAVRLDIAAPFAYVPHLDFPSRTNSMTLEILTWVSIYAISILGYFMERSRQDARPVTAPRSSRGRGGTPYRRVAAAA